MWVWACGGDTVVDTGSSSTQSGATNATSGSGASGATSSASSGAGGGGDCMPACGVGLECCNGACINPNNDILNCGGCGAATCPGPNPFCNNGVCAQAPCDPNTVCTGIQSCCGSSCCMMGMLCCVVPAGPLGPPTCTAPVNGTCPPGNPGGVCASPDTPIATPAGERPIAALDVGDLIYSVDGGVVKVVPILRVSRTPVRAHRVVRVELEGGSILNISAMHPTADGRSFAALRAGDTLGGLAVARVELVGYAHAYTHDILPDSDSGGYFAAGALVGSTLAKGAAPVMASVAPPSNKARNFGPTLADHARSR